MKFLIPFSMLFSLHAEISMLPLAQGKYDPNQTVVWSPLWHSAWLAQQEKSPEDNQEAIHELQNLMLPFADKAAANALEADHILISGNDDATLYEKANDESGKRWQFRPFAKKSTAKDPDRAILAILHKTFYFKVPFERAQSIPLPFVAVDGATDVQFFGTANGDKFPHVKVLNHDPILRTQALQIPGRNAEESAILYTPEKNCSFFDACATLRPLIKACAEAKGEAREPFAFHSDDTILIPYVALHVSTDFAPFLRENKSLHTTSAIQKVFLQMDQIGTKYSYGSYQYYHSGGDPFGQDLDAKGRNFHYFQPFFLMLWHRNAEWPYLAVWLGDSSALQHWKD